MLSLVLNVLVGVPVKASVCHEQRLPFGNTNDHTLIWATPTGYSGSWEASIPDHVRRARDTHFSGKNRNRTKARWLTQVQDNSEWWVSWASLGFSNRNPLLSNELFRMAVVYSTPTCAKRHWSSASPGSTVGVLRFWRRLRSQTHSGKHHPHNCGGCP